MPWEESRSLCRETGPHAETRSVTSSLLAPSLPLQAKQSLTEREAKIEAVAEEIEHSLELLGATAIEDKLQARERWVMTGDGCGGGGVVSAENTAASEWGLVLLRKELRLRRGVTIEIKSRHATRSPPWCPRWASPRASSA